MQTNKQEKSIIKQNILQYIEKKGISQYDFYKKTGITRGVLSQNNGISEDNMMRFLAYFKDVNPVWLLTSQGEMLKTKCIKNEQTSALHDLKTTLVLPKDTENTLYNNKKAPEKIIGIQQIPLYDVTATAGIAQLFQSTHGHIPSDYISIPHAPRCDGAIYIKGDSMYPLLKSGDIVLYKEIRDVKNSICWGEMYIISYDNDGDDYVVIKYIHPGNDKDHVLLVSQNQHHASQEIPISWIRALALVKVSIRFNTMG